jgi:hypothetical protein
MRACEIICQAFQFETQLNFPWGIQQLIPRLKGINNAEETISTNFLVSVYIRTKTIKNTRSILCN